MNLDNRVVFLPLIFIDIIIFVLLKYLLSYHTVTISNSTDYSNIVDLNETF